MRKSFILITILLTINCLAQKEKEPLFGLNDSACIKIVANNIVDTLVINSYYFVEVPRCRFRFIQTKIAESGEYYLNFKTTRPGMVYFETDEVNEAYLIPNDTVEINIGFEFDANKKSKLYFRPKGPIQDYYQAKNKKFGYVTFINSDILPIKNLPSANLSLKSYSNIVKVLDSLVNLNNLFLDEYKNNLPDWFVDTEHADIVYGSELLIKRFYDRLDKAESKNIYYVNIGLDDQKAVYSSFFYDYLHDYLFYKTFKMDTVSKSNFAFNQFNREKPFIDSLLSGQIKENYIIYRLSDLYLWCENTGDIKKTEAYITANYPNLNNEQIKFLNSVKYQHVKTSLPSGSQAPGFYLKDKLDKFYRLSDFKGKLVYLNFWTSTSATITNDIQAINKLYSKLAGKPVEIINICLDSNTEKWKQILEKEKLKGINLICKGNWEKNLRNDYFIEEIPHFTLIDKEGKIISNKCGLPADIYKEILEQLKKE